jgi:MFS family permease
MRKSARLLYVHRKIDVGGIFLKNQTVKEKPTAAYILSLIGGILGLIVGFAFMVFSAIFAGYATPGVAFSVIIVVYMGIGIWCVVCSAIVIFAATRLNEEPWEHVKWGIVILVFSIVGLGSLLGLIGGILALVYRPESTVPPPPSVQAVTRICPKCGRVLKEDMKFCPYCGNELG